MSAALSATVAAAPEKSRKVRPLRHAPRNGRVDLVNDCLAWHLEWSGGKLASTGFENKLSGHTFKFSEVQELALAFSGTSHRIEIPWWRFTFGADEKPVAQDQEQGLKRGYHLPATSDQDWGVTENLLLRGLRGVKAARDAITYEGYGWFRRWVELPKEVQGQEIVLVLGGYDHLDWNEYWIYVNGIEIGHRTVQGRWRTPGQFSLTAASPAYASLRFGAGERNLIALRTRGYDKHFGGYSDEVLRHYVFEPSLADQFITVGQPYLHVTDFEVAELNQSSPAKVTFLLRSQSLGIHASVNYELDDPTRRKWVEIENSSGKDLLFLAVC